MRMKNKPLKKIIGIMLIIALTASMTACSKKKDTSSDITATITPQPTIEVTEEPTVTTEPSPTTEAEVTPEAAEDEDANTGNEISVADKMHDAFEISELKEISSHWDEAQKKELSNITIQYPQIENAEDLATIDQVNKQIKDEVDAAIENHQKAYEDMAQSVYISERTYQVTFNKNYLISIVYTDVLETGGAYPTVTQTSYTYDLLTGKKLEAVDLMNMTEQEVNDMISESFTTIINEEPDRFFENARDIAVKEAPNAGFYLQNGCIMFYFNEDVLAPHAGGIQEFGSDISSIPESYKEPERLL